MPTLNTQVNIQAVSNTLTAELASKVLFQTRENLALLY